MTAMIYHARNRETISSVATSTGFTSTYIPPNDDKVVYAIVQALGGDVRFRVDGSAPTTSAGMRLVEDRVVEIWGFDALKNFRAIDDGATATLEVIYMGS